MTDSSLDPLRLQRELAYYKRQLESLASEHIKLNHLVSRLSFDLKKRHQGFSLLADLQRTMGGQTESHALFRAASAAINAELAMDRTVVFQPFGDGVFTPVQWCGYPAEQSVEIQGFAMEFPPTGWLETDSLIVNESSPSSSFIEAIRASFGLPYFILIPIKGEEKLIGLLLTGRLLESTGFAGFSPPLGETDGDTLKAVAGLISALVQSRQLTELRAESARKELELEKARELEKAYTQLKRTQAQLIQQEKLASLGSLTAGIAHEIKNPLNFVNNFAQLSIELADEIEQEMIANPNMLLSEVMDVFNALKSNAQKIAEHGRRADGIVRSMLEHSRSTTGEYVQTDVNALVEEYLALTYHGMCARYPDFEARLERNYDPTVRNIELVPQEFGRVLLNVFGNAFDAVREKTLSFSEPYQPTISVSTHNTDHAQEIRIQDNGSGIPAEIREKIFEPFFTTKPTGQGTGLGLSLSYDIIVQGYGGEIALESDEDGTVFIVRLPTHSK